MTAPQPDATYVGILTISDRASSGEYEDRGGPSISLFLEEHFKPVTQVKKIIPDERNQIEQALTDLCATCCLVLTTGGTGPSPRDVTPEATETVCHKMLPGFGEVMRAVSFTKVPTAILSRQTAGICGASLIINLPGSPKAIAECLEPVFRAIPHAIRIAGHQQEICLLPEFVKAGKTCGCTSKKCG